MNFDNPAWKATPVRTAFQVFKSLLRRRIPLLSRVPVPYDGGRSLIYADLATPLGLELYRYGHRDPDLDLIGRLLAPGDTFVDGGANVGLFTLVAAACVGKRGKVLAFEPGRVVRLRLLENVLLNGFQQVAVLPFALASQSGEASFRAFDIVGAGLSHLAPAADEAGDVETVALTTLDAAIAPPDRKRLSLIKLDLEGAEHAALLGASAILEEAQPDILLEVEPTHLARMRSTADDIATLLRRHRYAFFRLTCSAAGEISLRAVDQIVAPGLGPNVFATVDPGRVGRRGIAVS
jgi:FkbM family methyltransferase